MINYIIAQKRCIMKVTDNFYGSNPNYENRKLFAQLLSPYDVDYDYAAGYKDAVREIEESNKSWKNRS